MDYSYRKDYLNCEEDSETTTNECPCEFALEIVGLCDTSSVRFSTSSSQKFRTDYNWTEISIPEILTIPDKKPDIEHIDKVLISAVVSCTRLVETPLNLEVDTSTTPNVFALDSQGFPIPIPNAEGTYLTGRKLIVEGYLKQKIVYTADVSVQSVHSAHFEMPFSAFIIVYPKFVNVSGGVVPVDTAIVDVNQDFCVETCIEDVFAKELDERTIFKNVTLFLRAKPSTPCY